MKLGLASWDWGNITVDGKEYPALGGCGWIRLGQYASKSRHEIAIGRAAFNDKLRVLGIQDPGGNFHFDCDIIVLQRVMAGEAIPNIKAARANGQIVLNDVDDWYWGVHPSNPGFVGNHPKNNPVSNINFYREILLLSDSIIVSTPYLADRLDWIPAKKKVVFENHIEFSQYAMRTQQDVSRPTIGWTGSVGMRGGDLKILHGVLGPIQNDFTFHHTGHGEGWTFAGEVGLPESAVSTLPFMWIGDYRTHGFGFDIGLVPILDNPFNRAKSWLKGLEYTAAGIPFVASPLVEYQRFKDIYGAGRLAKNAGEWKKHLFALRSFDARAAEAAENREKAAPLDLSVGVVKWDDMIESFSK